MPYGTVKTIKTGGFGFIRQKGGALPDVFFHSTQLRGGLEFGDQLVQLDVEYDVQVLDGRERAVNVRPIEDGIPRVQRVG